MARPRIEIDSELVKKLASIFCTVEQIATMVGCSKDTLERRFAAIIKEGREHGRTSLLKKQFETAMKGNVSMLIWLGKQHLDQKDKEQVSVEADVTVNLITINHEDAKQAITQDKFNQPIEVDYSVREDDGSGEVGAVLCPSPQGSEHSI